MGTAGDTAHRARAGAGSRPEARIFSIIGQFAMMQGIVAATGIVRNKVVAYRLGPAGFGDFAQIALVGETLLSLVTLGMGVGLSRNAARAATLTERQSQVSTANAVVLGLSALACLGSGAALLTGRLLPLIGLSPTSTTALVATALIVAAVPFDALRGNYLAFLQGILDVKGLAIRRGIAVLIATAVAVPLVWVLGFIGAALQLLLLSVLVAALLGGRCRTLGYAPLAVRFDRAVAIQLAAFGIVSLASGFTRSLSETAMRTELIRVWGASANGVFQAPWILAQTLKGIVLTSIGTIALATIPAHHDRAETSAALERLLAVVVPVAASALGLLGLLGAHALTLLYSRALSEGAGLFPLLLPADVLMACAWVFGAPLLAYGDRALWLCLELVFAAVRTGIAMSLIPRLGTTAVAIAYLGAVALHGLLNLIVFRWRYRLEVRRSHGVHVLLAIVLVTGLSLAGSRGASASSLAAGGAAWLTYSLFYARRLQLLAELRRRFWGPA